MDCFLFTVYFKSLYTLIPEEDAITMIRKIVFDFQTVIPNAQLIINLLSLVYLFFYFPLGTRRNPDNFFFDLFHLVESLG